MIAGLNTIVTAAVLLSAAAVAPARAQSQDSHSSPPPAGTPQRGRTTPLPFGVGEQLDYLVAVGGARVGTGKMHVIELDTVRGHTTFHSQFTVQGGFLMFKVNDVMETWFDTTSLSSLRFVQNIHEVSYKTKRAYEIYPNRATYQQEGDTVKASVPAPLDDAAFLYFVRTVPLEVGKTYTFQRYFRPDRNPVIVKVLRRERVKVPAGTFNTIVIQPIIKSQGIFAEGGEAQMWLTDDDRRMMVQFKAKVPYLKTLDLYLQSYQPPTNGPASKP
ncbi:MAG: DUF3108 domain-containing protein [Gemmatimonadaceae bacterium]|nr:DUF3108 domain-containing protein [Gemmatimonadaceae bacterium]